MPLPLEQLDVALAEVAAQAPIDTALGGRVRLLVPVPQAVFDPRLLIRERIDPEFAATLAERLKGLKVGKGTEAGVNVGPLIDEQGLAKVEEHVADALANLRAARESQADAEASERAATRALDLAHKRYDAGYSGYLELLDAQRTANSARLLTVANRQAQLAATVELFKALGGGWRDDELAIGTAR